MVRSFRYNENDDLSMQSGLVAYGRGPLRLDGLTGSTYSVASKGDVEEGDDIVFVVRRSGGLLSSGEVQFQIKSGSAKIGDDFIIEEGYHTLKFPALSDSTINVQEEEVTISTVDDHDIEIDESLMILLRPSSSLDQISGMTSLAKIKNDDVIAKYSMSFDSTKVEEGTPIVLTINRTDAERSASILLSLKGSSADIDGDTGDVEDIGEMNVDFEVGQSSANVTLNTIDDDEVEISESFFVRIDSDSKVDQIDKGLQLLEIKDNDDPSEYKILKPDETEEGYLVIEDYSGPAYIDFKITRSGGIEIPGSVYFWFKNGTAKGDDFSEPTLVGEKQKIEFSSGQSEETVRVYVQDDQLVEGEEFFYGRIRSFNLEDRVLKGSQKAIITDDDLPTEYSFVVEKEDSDGVFEETLDFQENESINLKITRSQSEMAGSVRLSLKSATAKAGKDFIIPSFEDVEFAEGVDIVNVPIELIDDYSVERDEMFFASLKPNSRTDLVDRSRQKILIQDDDTAASYTLSAIPFVLDADGNLEEGTEVVGGGEASVDEGNTVRFKITRSGGNLAAPGQVRLRTMSGSAKDPRDFAGVDKQVIDFPAGVDVIYKDVVTEGDFRVERDETFSAVIRAVGKQDQILNRQQYVRIIDNDEPATFSITADQSEVEEGGDVTLTISKNGGEGRTSSVIVSTSNDVAKSGKDYEKTILQLDFDPDSGNQKTLTIPTLDDQNVESSNESFYVNIKSAEAQDSVDSDNSRVKVSILDNDSAAQFSITASQNLNDNGEIVVDESDSIVFTVTKTGGQGRTSVALVSTSNGSAKAGRDFTKMKTVPVAFEYDPESNETSQTQTITIQTADDEEIEGGSDPGENFFVNIETVDSADSISGDSSLDVEIVDDDEPAEFSVSSNVTEVNEGEDIVLTVTKNGGDGRNSAVLLTTSNGSAEWGRDYQKEKEEFIFIPGDVETQTFTIQTVDDEIIENDSNSIEDFYIKLKTLQPEDSVTGGDLKLTIKDDDKPAEFSITADSGNTDGSNFVVDEAGSIVFTITKTAGEGRTSSVLVATKNKTARSGSDFEGVQTEFEFAEDVVSQTFTIATNADEEIEGGESSGETFSLKIKPRDPSDTITGQSTRQVTIVDDDEPAEYSISVSSDNLDQNDNFVVDEASSIVFTITKTGGEGRASSLFVRTKNFSASSGSDFVGKKTTLEFPEDITSQTFTVVTNPDEEIEGGDDSEEKFVLNLKVLDENDKITGGKSREVAIVDDDEPAVFSISASKSELEEGENVVVTITKTGGEGRQSSVNVRTKNGSAKSGSDYLALDPVTLLFEPADTTRAITIQTKADEEIEGQNDAGENFFFDIKPIDISDSVSGQSRLQLTIKDPIADSSSDVVADS